MDKYIAFMLGWRIFTDEQWTGFEARKQGETVTLSSTTLDGLLWLISLRIDERMRTTE